MTPLIIGRHRGQRAGDLIEMTVHGALSLADITAPLLRSAVVATWCFVFVAVIRELSAAVILFTSETKVLSVLIFDLKESGDVGAIAVLSLAMIAITTVVIVLANRLGGSRVQARMAG
mgnify:CR=1 FL=1